MFQQHTIRADLKRTLILALPLIGAQLLQMANGLVDAIVAGRLGRIELAAGGIGAAMWFFVSLLCIGLMAGLSPTLSELIGDRRRNAVGKVFRQGLWLGVITGVIGTICLLLMYHYLDRTALDPELIPSIRAYLITSCWSMPAMAIILAARNVCEAVNLTRPVLLVQFLGLLVNIIVDLTLGLGLFGFPKLGMYGIGLATSSVMIVMALVLMLLLTGKRFVRYNLFASLDAPDWAQIKPLLVLSIPIFFALVFEAGLFAATGFQSGIFGTLEASAHFIAIGATAFCYMLPLGLSFALTARVGRVYGRKHMPGIRLRVLSGLIICIAMAIGTAIVLLLFRHQITAVYTNDLAVRAFAASLLLVSVVFQLSDGMQAVLLGMLRGLQDTRVPMLINAFSYWVIAFGAGYLLSRNAGWGVYGLWAGLVIGLTVSSLLLGWRLKFKLNTVARFLSSAQV